MRNSFVFFEIERLIKRVSAIAILTKRQELISAAGQSPSNE